MDCLATYFTNSLRINGFGTVFAWNSLNSVIIVLVMLYGDFLIQAESKLVVACVCFVSQAVVSKTGFKKQCMHGAALCDYEWPWMPGERASTFKLLQLNALASRLGNHNYISAFQRLIKASNHQSWYTSWILWRQPPGSCFCVARPRPCKPHLL